MIKRFISYVLLWFTAPKALAEAVNEAATVSEMDDIVLEKAGFGNG